MTIQVPEKAARVASAAVLGLMAIGLMGCPSNPVKEIHYSHAAHARDLQFSTITGDELSLHTRQVLHILDLSEKAKVGLEEMPRLLDKAVSGVPDWQRLMAKAEIYYSLGQEAHGRGDRALALFMESLLTAYHVLHERLDAGSVFDPRQRLLAEIYNRGLAHVITIAQETHGHPKSWHTLPGADKEWRVSIVKGDLDLWDPEYFDRFTPSEAREFKGLPNHYREFGVGAALIAERDTYPEHHPRGPYMLPKRQVYPATAILRPTGDNVLELLFMNPSHATTAKGSARALPLSIDFSAPLGHLIAKSTLDAEANPSFFDPEEIEHMRGIYMLDPYDPNKIPVMCVHGLWSNPLTWVEFMNEFYGEPWLRDRYQLWVYLYPTGFPILYNAWHFRESIQKMRKDLDPELDDPAMQNWVMMGHSMGGLLTHAMASTSGDKMWNALFSKPLDELRITEEEREMGRKLHYWQALPFIKRVIFVSSPHGGSPDSDGILGFISDMLISLPKNFGSAGKHLEAEEPGIVRGSTWEKMEAENSVDNLSTKSTMLLTLRALPVQSGTPFHTILGDLTGKGVPDGSDGVVPAWSAHLDGAESELVVVSDHHAHGKPLSLLELRRILHLHLQNR